MVLPLGSDRASNAPQSLSRKAPPVPCASFDHLVGAIEQLERDFEAERFGGLEIDDQLELGGLLHREIGRLFSANYPIDIRRRWSELIGNIDPIGNQAALSGEIPRPIDRGQPVPSCELEDQFAVSCYEGVWSYDKSASRH